MAWITIADERDVRGEPGSAKVQVITALSEEDADELDRRDLGAAATGAAAAVAHARAGEAAGAGAALRDGRGVAGRERTGPAEGRDPGVPAGPAGRAGLLRHHRARRAGRPGARRLRVLHGVRGARPGVDVDREHPGAVPGPGDGGGRRRPPR